jgi:hypothetical protein
MDRAPLAIATIVAVMAGCVEAAGLAPDGDPLHSPACVAALKSLQAEESGPSGGAARDAPPAGLVAARRQAAAACLANRADPPPAPQRMAQPPITVAPVDQGQSRAGAAGSAPAAIGSIGAAPIASTRATISAAPPLPALAPALPAPASPPPAPTTILSCDIVGCWASDGSRLNRVWPNLWGTPGACTAQGALLQCP